MTDVDLSLQEHEALVLFEFVSRFRDEDQLKVDHPAEAQILWDICAMVEKQIVDLLVRADYKSLLEEARQRVEREVGR